VSREGLSYNPAMVLGNDNGAAGGKGDLVDRLGNAIRLGIGFLTRLPIAPPPHVAPGDLAAAAWAFPAIGGALGLLAGIVFAAAAWLGLPMAAAALLALGALAWLTGALHEDGLADTADGFGGRTRTAKLEIMRDSRIGTFGVIALIVAIGLKVAALAAIGSGAGGPGAAIAGLIAAAALSRAALAPVMLLFDPARAEGLGAEAGRPSQRAVALALAIGLLLAAGALISYGAAAFFVAVVCGLIGAGAVSLIAARQVGGYTGDVLGAVQQAAETAVLLALSAVLA